MSTELQLSSLAFNINDAHHHINIAQESITEKMHVVLKHAINAGEYLIQAKTRIPHGEFKAWVAANLKFSYDTANDYMNIAKRKELFTAKMERAPFLSVREALRLIADEQSEKREVEVDLEQELDTDLLQNTPTPEPSRPVRSPKVEVLPPASTDIAEPSEVTLICAKPSRIIRSLSHLSNNMENCARRGWRTPEEGRKVVTELHRLLAMAEMIPAPDKDAADDCKAHLDASAAHSTSEEAAR